MRAVLVFPRATPAIVRAHVRPDDLVVAIDAGADALHAAGVRPARVVGDLDSVSPAALSAFEKLGVPIERHPSAKRDTDAALALAGLGAQTEILFLGPGGGRADHALANLHLMAAASRNASVRAIDEGALTWIVTPQRPLELALPAGTTISVLPWDAACEGVTYDGMRYPLLEATLREGDPFGMSNVTATPPQRIRVRSGRLVVVQPIEPKP